MPTIISCSNPACKDNHVLSWAKYESLRFKFIPFFYSDVLSDSIQRQNIIQSSNWVMVMDAVFLKRLWSIFKTYFLWCNIYIILYILPWSVNKDLSSDFISCIILINNSERLNLNWNHECWQYDKLKCCYLRKKTAKELVTATKMRPELCPSLFILNDFISK